MSLGEFTFTSVNLPNKLDGAIFNIFTGAGVMSRITRTYDERADLKRALAFYIPLSVFAAEMKIEAMEREVSKHVSSGKRELLYPPESTEVCIYTAKVCFLPSIM